MTDKHCNLILNRLGFAYAYLSQALSVIKFNSLFSEYCTRAPASQGADIRDLLPETVGLDEIFKMIAGGQQDYFQLPFINRTAAAGGSIYFHLHLLPTGREESPLLCLIENCTELAREKQQAAQQKNQIRLLETMLASRSDFLTSGLLGNSERIDQIRTLVRKISKVPAATILLTGESGTGKNLLARIIHYSSNSPDSPFVEINCAAIPETLLESELFGYEKGAFTNALSSKKGLLEEANGGTLFLDEIGELPLTLQAKLLSVLETRRFRRLGSNVEQKVEMRIITATNRDLSRLVRDNAFRQDLYFRLNVVNISLPPLRDLGDDVLILANHFIQVYNVEFKKEIRGLTQSAEQKLLNYQWPGNVRELSNCIERAMIFVEDHFLDGSDIVLASKDLSAFGEDWILPDEGVQLEAIEKRILQMALDKAGGNKTRAAALLGLSRDTLRYRLEKFKLSGD